MWLELLFLMHESDERGKLMLAGKPISEERLANILHIDKQKITTMISIYLELGVASLCVETGALMSRRMVRDEDLINKRREAGKKGGNPDFKKGEANPYYQKDKQPDKQKDKQTDKQKITPSFSSSSSDKEINKERGLEIFDEFRKAYPGSKRGNHTEFENLCKKHDKWREILPLLKPSLESQIKHKEKLKAANRFIPEWPNMTTFINQKRWETETEAVATPPPPEDKQVTAFKTLEEKDDYWGGRNPDFKPQMQLQ